MKEEFSAGQPGINPEVPKSNFQSDEQIRGRVIDLENYPRRKIFDAFKDRDIPTYSITSLVDITAFKPFAKELAHGFFVPFSFLLSKAVNAVPEFRHRIVDGNIREFERVHPGFTILQQDRTFAFSDSLHFDEFAEYGPHAQEQIRRSREHPICDTGEKHHMFFISNLPWISFTAITHPFDQQNSSIPIISMGKYFSQGGQLVMPIGVQVNHALVDGIHLGDFYNILNDFCANPSRCFS
jgi:chloramphenicol O-acetyltransferase type A